MTGDPDSLWAHLIIERSYGISEEICGPTDEAIAEYMLCWGKGCKLIAKRVMTYRESQSAIGWYKREHTAQPALFEIEEAQS